MNGYFSTLLRQAMHGSFGAGSVPLASLGSSEAAPQDVHEVREIISGALREPASAPTPLQEISTPRTAPPGQPRVEPSAQGSPSQTDCDEPREEAGSAAFPARNAATHTGPVAAEDTAYTAASEHRPIQPSRTQKAHPTVIEAIRETDDVAPHEREARPVPSQVTLQEVREWVAATPAPGEAEAGPAPRQTGISALERAEDAEHGSAPSIAQKAAAGARAPFRIENQDLKLSIGTIHVTVEAPESSTVARPAPAPAMSAPSVRSRSRLSRHYLNVG